MPHRRRLTSQPLCGTPSMAMRWRAALEPVGSAPTPSRRSSERTAVASFTRRRAIVKLEGAFTRVGRRRRQRRLIACQKPGQTGVCVASLSELNDSRSKTVTAAGAPSTPSHNNGSIDERLGSAALARDVTESHFSVDGYGGGTAFGRARPHRPKNCFSRNAVSTLLRFEVVTAVIDS